MKLREVKEILAAEIIIGEEKMDMEVKTAFGADLMSDVLAFAKAGSMLITGLTNDQVVRTADILDIAAIIMVRGKKPTAEAIKLAKTTGCLYFDFGGYNHYVTEKDQIFYINRFKKDNSFRWFFFCQYHFG